MLVTTSKKFKEHETILKDVKKNINLSDQEIEKIIDFLQGAVYCWCKSKKEESFYLKDIVDTKWEGTPMYKLYKCELDNKTGALNAGLLLKAVLIKDIKEFELLEKETEEAPNKYKWNKKEENK